MTAEALDKLHPSHITRMSDASSFDEICINCGHTDSLATWGRLAYPCPNEPQEHKVARLLDASREFVDSVAGNR